MANDWLQLTELFSTACVIWSTVFIMQHLLNRAHYLLRLGIALVCAGSVMEMYASLQSTPCDPIHAWTGVIENIGQAAVYVWAATSRRLWNLLDDCLPAGHPK